MTADPVDFEIAPGDAESAPAELPKELEGKSAADIWKLVEAEKTRATVAETAAARANAIAQEVALAALDSRRAAPTPAPLAPAVAAPNREEDPDAWMAYEIKRQVDAGLKPLTEGYQRDRQVVMGGLLDGAKRAVATQFPDWAEHEAAINDFVRNYPADVLAQPGALEEAYYRVKGRATSQKEQEARIREQAGVESRGRVGVGDRPEPAKFTDDQVRISANLGVDLKAFGETDGSGRMDIDEYLAIKAKATKPNGDRNAAR